MKKIKALGILSFLFIAVLATAQTPVAIAQSSANLDQSIFPIFSYGGEMVYNDEFMRVFNKNKRGDAKPTQEEIEEYLGLYTKFKLKVAEAYSRKMDTIPSFINELAGYRKQLAQPYLTDKSVTDRLIKEAYDRGLQEVNASHLLVNCPSDANAKDTAEAYQKVMGLRNRIVEGNESFEAIAEQYSDDPSSKTNKGNLGYFTAFQMIYTFENAAYNNEVGAVSMPVRTQYGYHLLFVKDKRKSLGDIKVAHIMIKYYNENQIDSTKRRIDAVYEKLQKGGDWSQTVEEFSEDFNTNSRGGDLNWFNRTTSNIPVEFKDVAYDLKNNGEYSAPVKTKFGWHIIKRMDSRPVASFEESKDIIKRKVERDSRSELNKEAVIARLKVENKFKEVEGLAAVKGKFTEELLKGNFERPDATEDVLFVINQQEFIDANFYDFITDNKIRSNRSLDDAVKEYYANYIKKANLAYEESILETKYDDFRYIMQEYKDGILLFELTDQEVWSKAVDDSAGLADFYSKNQANYVWKERAQASIFSCKDAKTAKKAMKLVSNGSSVTDILSSCNSKDALAVKVEDKKFEQGKNALLDKIEWKEGVYMLENENDRVKFVRINTILSPSNKPIEENLGQATSDYQNYLENIWIESLKKKYPLHIYSENVKRLYN